MRMSAPLASVGIGFTELGDHCDPNDPNYFSF